MDYGFLPYQQELMKQIGENDVVVIEKSRRTGYSALAGVSVLKASSKIGQDVFYMGYDQEMAREYIDTVGAWAKVFAIAGNEIEEFIFKDPDNPEKEIKAFRTEFANGKKIVALPSVPRALRGKQGFVIIDEAAFPDDLKEVLKSALALLMWRGNVVINSTHNGDDNPFNELIKDIGAGKKPYKLLRYSFDDALNQGLFKRICLKLEKFGQRI